MLKQPIFILGSHKSGTTLLRCLFDDHPELFAIPIESHFFQIIRYWIDYAFTKKHKPNSNISKKDFIQNSIGCIKYSNNDSNSKGDGLSLNIFDLDFFEKYLYLKTQPLDIPLKCLAQYFEVYAEAIYYSIYKQELNKEKRIVEKSVENAEFALDLIRLFPDAFFIHIIRNPYSNLISMKEFRMYNKKSRNYPWLGKDLNSLYNSYYYLYKNKRLIENYLVIKYEDLVTNPDLTMKNICQVTKINFMNTMLHPSYLGSPWKGNSSNNEKFQGISNSRINGWQQKIDPLIVQLINKHFIHILEDFNYEIIYENRKKNFLFPNKKEMPKEYIANRFLYLSS